MKEFMFHQKVLRRLPTKVCWMSWDTVIKNLPLLCHVEVGSWVVLHRIINFNLFSKGSNDITPITKFFILRTSGLPECYSLSTKVLSFLKQLYHTMILVTPNPLSNSIICKNLLHFINCFALRIIKLRTKFVWFVIEIWIKIS